MWVRYRKWKHAVAPVLVAVGSCFLLQAPEQSVAWFVGLGLVILVALAYVFDEVLWNIQGGYRPCAACGHRVRMRSFQIRNNCPGCGQQL